MSLVIMDVSIRQDDNGLYSLDHVYELVSNRKSKLPSVYVQKKSFKKYVKLNKGICHSWNRSGPFEGSYVSAELVLLYAMWVDAEFAISVVTAFNYLLKTASKLHK